MNLFDYELSPKCVDLLKEKTFKPWFARILNISIKCKRKKSFVENVFVTNITDYPSYSDAFDAIAARLYAEGKCTCVENVSITVKGFNTSYNRAILTTTERELPNVEELEPLDDFKGSLEKLMYDKLNYYSNHTMNKEYINKLNNNYGMLLLLALYVKYVARISSTYGKFIDDPKKYDGFYNSESNECVYIRRKEFNKFVSFMLHKNLSMKDWFPEFLSKNKKYVVEAHKSNNSSIMLKLNKHIPDSILLLKFASDNEKYVEMDFINYLVTEIRIYKQLRNVI